jgi:hypothetical protein
MPDQARVAPEFAIRLPSIDALFDPLDARPVAERQLTTEVHQHLLDDWEHLRVARPRPETLTLYAPASEQAATDQDAVRAAIGRDLRAFRGRLKHARPLPRHERLGTRVGIVLLFICIAISTALSRSSDAVLIEGAAQGILVVGWVALWQPAAHFALDVIPHMFNRKRYREFADVEVRFYWTPD